MKIIIATPLYPPDIADPAPYVKKLASLLAHDNEVTVLAYNHIPEEIEGVTIVPIEKCAPVLLRLFLFTKALIKYARVADVVYIQNGPSTELPMLFSTLLTHTPHILRLGDESALCIAGTHAIPKMLQRIAISRASIVITHTDNTYEYTKNIKNKKYILNLPRPLAIPEILPFSEYPQQKFISYNDSWDTHISKITSLLEHATK